MAEIDLRPPEGVRNAARRGLALRREFGRGGTAVGVARARDLSRGANISPSTIRRMMSYFARHGSYPKDPDPSAPSTGYIAWMLWGGDAGKRWARAMAERLDKAGKSLDLVAQGAVIAFKAVKRKPKPKRGGADGAEGGSTRRRGNFNESQVKRDGEGQFAPKTGGDSNTASDKPTPKKRAEKPKVEDTPEYQAAQKKIAEAEPRLAEVTKRKNDIEARMSELANERATLNKKQRDLQMERVRLQQQKNPSPETEARIGEITKETFSITGQDRKLANEIADIDPKWRSLENEERAIQDQIKRAKTEIDDIQYSRELSPKRLKEIEETVPSKDLSLREREAATYAAGVSAFKKQVPDAEITVRRTPSGKVEIAAKDAKSGAAIERTLTFDRDGKLDTVSNDFFSLGDKAGGGAGTTIFSSQVDEARRLGAKKLVTVAGSDPSYSHNGRNYALNGYYTWARLGYDGALSSSQIRQYREDTGRNAETVQDIMRTSEGADWWKENGEGFGGTFDLSPRSKSIRALNAYKRKKGIKALKAMQDQSPLVSPFEIDDEEERLWREVWAEINAEDEEEDGQVDSPLTMTKAADGLRLMLIVTTNAYQDREGEIVTRKALEADTNRRWKDGRFVEGDPVVYWHDDPEQYPDRIIGDVVYANMHGDFLVEVARERPTDYARKVWDFVQKGDRAWGASHGFQYRAGEKAQGEYSFTRKFETSILPLQNAANGYTFAGVLMSDAQQAERQALLDQILGEGTANMVNQKTAQKGKKLDKAGVRRKAMDEKPPEEKAAEQLPEEEKAMTAEQVADQVMAIAASEGDETAKRQALIDLINAVIGAGEDVKETDDVGEMEDEYAEDEEAVKAFKAFADGVQAAQEKQAAGLSEVQKRLAELPTIIQRLDARFKALEGKLAMTPRAASRAAETEVTDLALLERVKAQTEKVDPFWGVKVKGE